MHSKWLGRVGLTALVAGIVGGSSGMVGCAAERDPINRVQGNAIPKSFFIGQNFQDSSDDPEFYGRSMIIKVPYGESGADWGFFTNSINMVSRIKWSIEEGFLQGRVSYERIPGSDGQGLTPKENPERDPSKPLTQNDGVVVYQFRIQSHFDIRRQYNAQTGEESNVVEENSTDRRWEDREYIRVDFSQNLSTASYEFDTMSLLGIYGGVQYQPMAIDVRNPNDENAPVYDIENGYFDVTNKVYATPRDLNIWGMTFPGCLLPNLIRGGSEPVGNCNANEITVRHSFKRVVPTDYEAQDWDGNRFSAYGAFTTDRNGYARDYGMVDSKWKRFIARYNIWERSHAYANPEKMEGATACKVDSQCEGVGQVVGSSHCDTLAEKCTLPIRERKAKPIVWHYSQGSNPEYFDATREATDEWDTAMRVAVQAAKYAECQRFTPNEDCAGEFPGVLKGNFADEEDAMYLVKEVNACRRTALEAGQDPHAQCDALAEEIGTARKYSQQAIELAQLPEMVVLCHSPVKAGENPLCGKEGDIARLGDLRHHLVTSITQPETNSPWGIMSDGNDPVTGEHVAASINVWTHVNDLFSRGLVDTLRYIGGELKTEEITDGRYIDNWVEAARRASGSGLTPQLSSEEIDKRVAAVAGTTPDKMHAAKADIAKMGKFQTGLGMGPKAQLKQALVNDLKKVANTRSSIEAPSSNTAMVQARMNLAAGTPLEAEVNTLAMQQLAGSGFGSSFIAAASKTGADSKAKMAPTSIFQGLNPTVRRNLENQIETELAARGACVMNFDPAAAAPLAYVGLADVLQQKFGRFNPNDAPDVQAARADRMKSYVARRAHYAVIAHEMGHSFALRHNFVGSSFAWNYRPQYWALRTNARTVTDACPETGGGDGKDCVGPRWLDKVTANESRNLIQMWAASTTMDYAGEPTQDLLGLGTYDFAAAKMFYGDTVSVYSDQRFNSRQGAGACAIEMQDTFGGLLGYRYCDFSNPVHYSHLDTEIGLLDKCDTNVNAEAFKPANWDTAKDGEWSPLVDGHLVTNEAGKTTKCTQPKIDYVPWSAMKNGSAKVSSYDAKGRVRVPHGFATDSWADLGNVAVFRHDNGADLYELMHFWIAQQEMNHIFTNYRRGRRDFSVWGGFQRTLGRYHEKMRDSAKAIGLYVNLARDTVTQYNSGENPAGFVAEILKEVAVESTVASSIAFDHFAHVFSRPQPGEHGVLGQDDDVLRSYDGTGFAQTGRSILQVANGVTGGFGTISLAGRPIENKLSTDKGEYDRDYTLNVGSYYEKAFTSYLFTESADNFISASRDDFVDPRFRSVSLADVFPDGYRRWLANNLTNDEAIKGVYVRGKGGGPGPQPPDLDGNGYALLGSTSWWPTTGIEACFPSDDRISCRDPFGNAPLNSQVGPVIDAQVGWEQQKFAMIFSLLYLPDNARTNWLDQMHIYELGENADPGFANRIEFHDPTGKVYVAQTFGTETLYGKTVQKGIAARVLEYANELLRKSVVGTDILQGTTVIGYMPTLNAQGQPQFKQGTTPIASCELGRDCQKLKNYVAVPKLLREAMGWLGWTRGAGELKGVY